MANSRTMSLAATFGVANLLGAAGLTAALADSHHHRHDGTPRVIVTAPHQSWGAEWVTYRLNPFASYRWYGPGWSVGFGDWGSTPVYYPYARVWQHSGVGADPACNMPSSPCWDQDRE